MNPELLSFERLAECNSATRPMEISATAQQCGCCFARAVILLFAERVSAPTTRMRIGAKKNRCESNRGVVPTVFRHSHSHKNQWHVNCGSTCTSDGYQDKVHEVVARDARIRGTQPPASCS